MSTETVTLFLALLAVAAQAIVAVAAVLFVARRASPAAARVGDSLSAVVQADALLLALGVAAIAMAGSLWFSEGANFVPCKLCWYQRIAMYPLVPLLALAAWRRDTGVRSYGIALAVLGLPISLYHIVLERNPSLESGVCDPANPCSLIWVERFGYVTIPTMAASAFALIVVLLLVAHPSGGSHPRPGRQADAR